MEIAAKIDEYGKPAWILLMVLGFIVFWPIGLGILIYIIWSGRMGCSKHKAPGRWYNEEGAFRRNAGWGRRGAPPSSGNRAFDEYREETLKRLEDEHNEFRDFLSNLRHARDKAEFDQFMADRKARAKDTPKAAKDDGDKDNGNGASVPAT